MKLFISYFKQKRKTLGLLCLFSGIYIGIFALYRLPVAAAVYPMGMCLVIGMFALIRGFRKTVRLHRHLAAIQGMTDAVTMPLPEADGILAADYQQIIRLLCQEQSQRISQMNYKYQDMIDYYTVWAHQIKTPIASIKLHLQNEDSPLARQISSDLMRVEQYVQMVLMFLRLDSESTDYVIKEYDLDTIVRQTVRKFASEFIARKLRLIYDPIDAKVITDEKWLSFVVEQVLSNALKYTPSGSIHIYLEAPKTLCVRDTGIGIAAEDLPRIFEKGYTGYNGRSDKKASGIGLYLCRRICKNLGHTISAQSAPDQGTTIRINLAQKKLEVE